MAPPPVGAALRAGPSRPPEYECGHPLSCGEDSRREPALGSASDPWRVGQSGRRRLGANRLSAPAAIAPSAITDVADLLEESRRDARVDGFLYRTNPHRPSPVRLCAARTSSPTDRPL